MTRPPLSVSEFTNLLKSDLEDKWSTVSLVGEVSSLKMAQSGHVYFTLKDSRASLASVMWRSTVQRLGEVPEHGEQIEVTGAIKLYPPRGSYQLDIRSWKRVGQGDLEKRFQELKTKLFEEGLFDTERKKALPFLPRRIALVTSPTGAARYDMEKSIRDRFPVADLVLVGCPVQGREAVSGLVQALQFTETLKNIDVIVCGRGGGSLEDLWAFNEEAVVRAIAACPLPVVSAVGHEVDVTLVDFVSDARALTPTGVGALIVPEWDQLWEKLDDEMKRLGMGLRQKLEKVSWDLESIEGSRMWQVPRDLFSEKAQYLDEVMENLRDNVSQKMESAQRGVQMAAAQLEALSPLKVLARGYAVASHREGTLARADSTKVGDEIQVKVIDGDLLAKVHEVHHVEE